MWFGAVKINSSSSALEHLFSFEVFLHRGMAKLDRGIGYELSRTLQKLILSI